METHLEMTQPIDNGAPTEREEDFWREVEAQKTPSHYEYRNGSKIRVFDDPPDPTGDERMLGVAKIVCICAGAVLILLLLSLLSVGCGNNIDRTLWKLLE